jgi:hypothetical protein
LEKSTSYEAPHYVVFSNLLSLHLSLLNTLFSNTLSLCFSLNVRDQVDAYSEEENSPVTDLLI